MVGEPARIQASTRHRFAVAGVVKPLLVALPAVALALALGGAIRQIDRHGSSPIARATRDLQGLPLAAQGPVSAALAEGDPSYLVKARDGGLRASNPAQGLDSRFSAAG